MAVDPDELAAFLGVTRDSRVESAPAAATQWVVNLRPTTDDASLWADAGVQYGGLLYGSLLYQARVTPAGIVGYSDDPTVYSTTHEALYRARDLVGRDAVIS